MTIQQHTVIGIGTDVESAHENAVKIAKRTRNGLARRLSVQKSYALRPKENRLMKRAHGLRGVRGLRAFAFYAFDFPE